MVALQWMQRFFYVQIVFLEWGTFFMIFCFNVLMSIMNNTTKGIRTTDETEKDIYDNGAPFSIFF